MKTTKEFTEYIDGIINNMESEINKLREFKNNLESLSEPLEFVNAFLEKLRRKSNVKKTRKKRKIPRSNGYIFVEEVEKTLDSIGKETKAADIFKLLPEKVRDNHKSNSVYNTLWNYATRDDRFYKKGNVFGLIKWKQSSNLFEENTDAEKVEQ